MLLTDSFHWLLSLNVFREGHAIHVSCKHHDKQWRRLTTAGMWLHEKVKENSFFKLFQWNGRPRNFIKKAVNGMNKNPNERAKFNKICLEWLPDRLNHRVVHKLTKTERRRISKPKEKLKMEDRRDIIYKVKCEDCDKWYVGQTGRKLATLIHNPPPLMSVHEDHKGRTFNLDTVCFVGQANEKHSGEFLKIWHSSVNSIRKHTELDQIYNLLRRKI